jgi:hypothetical protein
VVFLLAIAQTGPILKDLLEKQPNGSRPACAPSLSKSAQILIKGNTCQKRAWLGHSGYGAFVSRFRACVGTEGVLQHLKSDVIMHSLA